MATLMMLVISGIVLAIFEFGPGYKDPDALKAIRICCVIAVLVTLIPL